MGVSAPARWPVQRAFPLLAAALLICYGLASTTWPAARLEGVTVWPLPNDLWGTLVSANRLLHGDLAGLYTQPTGLVSFPGAAVLLMPVVALIDAAGLSLAVPGTHNPHPAAWLLAGPYQMAVSAVTLLAADAIAERMGVTRPRRAVLAAAGAFALWNVSVRWGHPEDSVAVGLLLYAMLALSVQRSARPGQSATRPEWLATRPERRAAWLLGAAVAVQPLVLLALPVVAAAVAIRRLPGFLVLASLPSVVLLGAAAAANWTATAHAVVGQPNFPAVDHPTPWTALAPHLAGGTVAAGPGRALALVVACGCGIAVGYRHRRSGRAPVAPAAALVELLWWAAVALALRSVFESVMVAYYLWPPLAVALIVAARSWRRLVPTAAVVAAVTLFSQEPWRGPWLWWALTVAGLAATLLLAGWRWSVGWPARGPAAAGDGGLAVGEPRQAVPAPHEP